MQFIWKSSPLSCNPIQKLTAVFTLGPWVQPKISLFFSCLFLLSPSCSQICNQSSPYFLESWDPSCTRVSPLLQMSLIQSVLSKAHCTLDFTERDDAPCQNCRLWLTLLCIAQAGSTKAGNSFYRCIWDCNLIYWDGQWQQWMGVWLFDYTNQTVGLGPHL